MIGISACNHVLNLNYCDLWLLRDNFFSSLDFQFQDRTEGAHFLVVGQAPGRSIQIWNRSNWQRSSKLGFWDWAIISKKFLIERVPSCIILIILDSSRIRDLGQAPRLLGYGFKISDRTIDSYISTQLCRCSSGRKEGGRRTDDITISVVHIGGNG
jgi:hypothetical protein